VMEATVGTIAPCAFGPNTRDRKGQGRWLLGEVWREVEDFGPKCPVVLGLEAWVCGEQAVIERFAPTPCPVQIHPVEDPMGVEVVLEAR